jgi:large subunit ribosomal protein L30
VQDTPENLGMIRKVKDYVAYGEVDEGTITTLLETRGKVTGDIALTDEYVREHSPYGGIADFAKALSLGNARLTDMPGMKPVLRLHPPRKGYKTIKRTFPQGGALGYYGTEINTLLYKMR